jgi:hypothetical protein
MKRTLLLLAALAGCHRTHVVNPLKPILPMCPAHAPLVVPTFHGDRARSGWNAAETVLTPAAVAAGFNWLWDSPPFAAAVASDGNSYPARVHASPLYFDDLPVGGGTHSVIIAATSNSDVYAISACGDATSAAATILWKTHLTTPVFISHLDGGLPTGVLATPVADLAASPPRLYVTAVDAHAGWQLFALNLLDGAVLPGWPLTLDAATVQPLDRNGPAGFGGVQDVSQRGALNLTPDGSTLYVPFGSYNDSVAGWLVAVDTTRIAVAGSFSGARADVGQSNAGIWGPGGAAVDDDGSAWVTTGNAQRGPLDGTWGESLLRLSPTATLLGTYSPFNHCQLDDSDTDLGGSSPLLLPVFDGARTATPKLVVFGGKQGNVYLLPRDRLPGALDRRPPCSTDAASDGSLLPPGPQPQFGTRGPLNVFGPYTDQYGNSDWAKMRTTPAWFVDGEGNGFVFVSGATKAAANSTRSVSPSVAKLRLVLAPGAPAYLQLAATDTDLAFLNPGSPVVSSDGGAGPVVWVLDENASRTAGLLNPDIANPVLYAVDGTTMRVLWQSPKDLVFVGGKYATPLVAHGFVFVATDRLQAFGLRPPG